MFPDALVFTDPNATSDALIQCLEGLRKLGTHRILLLHLLDIQVVGGLFEQLQARSVLRLEKQHQRLEQMGFSVDVHTVLGFPHPEINRLIREREPALLIVHSKAGPCTSGPFLGGVAQDVLHRARRPVLYVHADVIGRDGGSRCHSLCGNLLEHVLLPTDFSAGAERAFAYAESLVQAGCKRFSLLHVMEATGPVSRRDGRSRKHESSAQDRTALLADRLFSLGAGEVSVQCVEGTAATEIPRLAEADGISLIAMGTHGRGGPRDLFLGHTSHGCVRHAPAPVLLIPSVVAGANGRG